MNLKEVETLNAASSSWIAGMTKYADMSREEFAEKILMRKQKPNTSGKHKKPRKSHDPVSSFDWRNERGGGAVSIVQDQGLVGTCWAFSAIGNVEGQHFMATNSSINLSEEYLVDCDGTYNEENGNADCSIYGGWPYLAYQFIIQQGGVPSDEEYPYCAGTGACYPCMAGPVNYCGPPPYYCDRDMTRANCPPKDQPHAATISDWSNLSQDEDELASQLMEIGPLSALMDATQLQYYESGVWTGTATPDHQYLGCGDSMINHAILIVGFGVDDTDGDYWSVKNSWGVDWGEDGYFRIKRGAGECAINKYVTSSYV